MNRHNLHKHQMGKTHNNNALWGDNTVMYFFRVFFIPKQSQTSRYVLQDRSKSLGLFRKGKTCIIAKFYRTDLVIYNESF